MVHQFDFSEVEEIVSVLSGFGMDEGDDEDEEEGESVGDDDDEETEADME